MADYKLYEGERLFQEVRKDTFRKEEFEYIHTGIIDEDGEMWTTTELDEANLFQVYNQYRYKHGIPFPDEIVALRNYYGLSAAKMSQILGFGINQYRLYEEGEVPSLSNARTIIAAKDKGIIMSFLYAAKTEMSDSEFKRIKIKIENTPGNFCFKSQPSEYSGYRTLSLEKIVSVVNHILNTIGETFVTKMNKLLFYVDFIHYRRTGYGITGINYKAMQYGPVPESWAKLYDSLDKISLEEFIYPSGQSGVLLKSKEIAQEDLTEKEKDTIEYVCQLFSNMTAGEISEISHKEKGWRENEKTHDKISYQSAFALNYM